MTVVSEPAWESSRGAPARTGRRPWIVSSAIVVGLAALVFLVWGLGGFERRTDLLRPTPAGATITVGPYELTFVGVTVQRKKDFSDRIYWALTAVGTGRTTGDVSIGPDYGETGTFVSRDLRSGEIETPSGVRYGDGTSNTDGSRFTPGLPPVPILVDFEYAETYVPGDTVELAVFQLEFSDNSLIGGQDPVWHKTNDGFDYRLPTRMLPDATT